MNLIEATEYLETEINKIGFGFSKTSLVNNLCESISIRWSIESKENWVNNIFHNATGGIVHLFKNEDSREHQHKEGFHFTYTNWRSGYKFRRASNKDLKKLCDNILKQLTTKYEELNKA